MRLALCLLLLAAFGPLPLAADEEPGLPFVLPVPEGWRTETIPFPLDFAPQIELTGVEELRFAPGMFTEGAEDFWSYAFIWWVPEASHFDEEMLRASLNAYFEGLSKAVGEPKEIDFEGVEFETEVRRQSHGAEGSLRFDATIRAFDAFVTARPIVLRARIEVIPCSSQQKLAAFFAISPQPLGARCLAAARGASQRFSLRLLEGLGPPILESFFSRKPETTMPRNIEIKARVADLPALRSRVLALATDGPQHLEQRDTFFPAETGRLKLRRFRDGSGELIFYTRPNRAEPKESTFEKVPCPDPAALEAVLSSALGVRGVVAKNREVFRVGQTRVHLDEVEGLGSFLELEVVLGDDESSEQGEGIARELLGRLEISADSLIANSYIDLLTGATTCP